MGWDEKEKGDATEDEDIRTNVTFYLLPVIYSSF